MTRPDHVVVVTGGSGGLGRASCVAFGRRGAAVVVSGRSAAELARTVAEVRRAGGTAVAVPADVTSEDDVAELFRSAIARFGRVTAVVAAAGVGGVGPVPWPVERTTTEDWQSVLATNLRGTFLVARGAFRAMREDGGDLVTVVSARAGTQGQPYAAAYSASKQAVAGLSLALARQGAASGIRVQALFPDAIDTAMLTPGVLAGPRMPAEQVAEAIVALVDAPRTTELRLPLLTSLAGPRPSTHRLLARERRVPGDDAVTVP